MPAPPRASCSTVTVYRGNNITNNTTNVNILSNNTFRNIHVNVSQGVQGAVKVGQKALETVKNLLKFGN